MKKTNGKTKKRAIVPRATVPRATVPRATVPRTTVSRTTDPRATVPGVTDPSVGRSSALKPSVRKPSHIPLFAEEHARLHAAARAVGLPYATWARATLLVVASWPVEQQPIRVGAIQVVLGKQTEISDEEIRRLAGVGFNIEHKETNS